MRPEGDNLLIQDGKMPEQVRVPILYYHRVAEGISPRQGVSPSVFKSQVGYLRRNRISEHRISST